MPYEFHPDLRTPPNKTVLWRYMDFARFVEMIESQSLWFSRVDQLEDPLEGTHTDAELAGIRKNLKKERAEQLIRVVRSGRTDIFVNCWRAGTAESLAMWDLFGKGSGVVAVKSTVGLLKRVVADYAEAVYISQLRYVDWSDSHGLDNVLVACSRKDLSYKHESEVRAMIMGYKPGAKKVGIRVSIDVSELISEVIVGPREKPWVVELVQNVMKRYKLSPPVVASDRLKPRPSLNSENLGDRESASHPPLRPVVSGSPLRNKSFIPLDHIGVVADGTIPSRRLRVFKNECYVDSSLRAFPTSRTVRSFVALLIIKWLVESHLFLEGERFLKLSHFFFKAAFVAGEFDYLALRFNNFSVKLDVASFLDNVGDVFHIFDEAHRSPCRAF